VIVPNPHGTCQRRLTVEARCEKPAVGKHRLCEECRAETEQGLRININDARLSLASLERMLAEVTT
jgi:hypothetical protein